MSMIDRVVVPDLIPSEIEYHVKRYLHLCDVNTDDVLSQYVIELAERIQVRICANWESIECLTLNCSLITQLKKIEQSQFLIQSKMLKWKQKQHWHYFIQFNRHTRKKSYYVLKLLQNGQPHTWSSLKNKLDSWKFK